MDWVTFIAIIVGLLFIFLIFREATCWYFKFNEMVSLLKQIRDK